jgi:hypothetical protein
VDDEPATPALEPAPSATPAREATWRQLAEQQRREHQVSMLAAMRLAHGWSQQRAAAEWTRRWPDDPKTSRNVAYWENWATPDGYPPGRLVLQRLAIMYDCTVADLTTDDVNARVVTGVTESNP